jgi:orotidine-5'-phosphate decarboxylase
LLRLAGLAQQCGLDGVVCSAHEIARLRKELGPDFLLVVPGIRPAGSAVGDQKRVMVPSEATRAGASLLVIGRPITGATDPALAAREIAQSLGIPAT